MRNITVGAGWTPLFLDGVAQPITIGLNRTVTFDILVSARDAAGNSAGWTIRGVIKNAGGAISLVGAPVITLLAADGPMGGCNVNVVPAGALMVVVTNAAAAPTRWVATVRTAEVNW